MRIHVLIALEWMADRWIEPGSSVVIKTIEFETRKMNSLLGISGSIGIRKLPCKRQKSEFTVEWPIKA